MLLAVQQLVLPHAEAVAVVSEDVLEGASPDRPEEPPPGVIVGEEPVAGLLGPRPGRPRGHHGLELDAVAEPLVQDAPPRPGIVHREIQRPHRRLPACDAAMESRDLFHIPPSRTSDAILTSASLVIESVRTVLTANRTSEPDPILLSLSTPR